MRKTKTTDGRETLAEYIKGDEVKQTNERSYSTTYKYDTFSTDQKFVKQIVAPEGVQIDFTRNELGMPLTITQDGVERTYGYDEVWRLVSYNEPEIEGPIKYTYDHAGNKISERHPTEDYYDTTYFSYDKLNRLIKVKFDYVSSYDGFTGRFCEEDCGRTLTRSTYLFEYDKNSNPIVKKKEKTKEKIDLDGYLVSESSQEITWNYTFDKENRMLSETLNDQGEIFQFSYHYNDVDHLESIIYPTGFEVALVPDAMGRATQVGDLVTHAEYFDTGTLKKVQYANGQVTEYTLNELLLPATMTIGRYQSPLINFSYQYDLTGNIESISDSIDASRSVIMNYDGLDRLVSAQGFWGEGFYNYDAMGNIQKKTIGSTSYDYIYDQNNRLEQFGEQQQEYDVYGRVINDGVNKFVYDFAGNLLTLTHGETVTDYEYDANDRMISKTIGDKRTRYVYTSSGKLMYEETDRRERRRHHLLLGSQYCS